MADNATKVVNFGHSMREQFSFEPNWRNFNHGSFGTYPRVVRNVLRQFEDLTEFAPDKFIFYQRITLLDAAREQIAKLVNAPVDECVFVQNATTGVNTVLRNIRYEEKDAIIYFDTIYGACEKTLVSVQETFPQVHLRKVEYTLPCSHADICTAFSQVVSRLLYEGYKPKIAVFETIASIPGVRFPFERLTKICKEYKIFSLIDAAHGVGQIPLNLTELDPDFLVTNCHKWLYTPRASALFFVPKRNQHLMRTTFPTSHGFVPADPNSTIRKVLPSTTKSDFVNNFEYVGTLEKNAYLCVPEAIRFRQVVCQGDEKIYAYMRDLAQKGADLLAAALGTNVMDDLDPQERTKQTTWTGTLRDCAMANIMLPIYVEGASSKPQPGDASFLTIQSADALKYQTWLQRTLINDFDTHVVVYLYAGRFWIRVSGQIYLELSDFEWLGDVLQQLLLRLRKGEALQTGVEVTVKAALIHSEI